MKRSTASWTTAVAASALLAMPVGSWAQQPTPSTTPGQQTTAPAQSGRTTGADAAQGSANEHVRLAQAALGDIPAASLTGTTKTRVAELKKHINALEQSASKSSGASAKSNANWSKDVAAADRIISELLGADSATSAGASATAGTSGSTATAPKTTTGSKSSASMALDESARTKLQEVRTHLTAFAASMSGAAASTPASSSDSTAAASASASAAPASATASASPAPASGAATATQAPTGTSGSTAATATPSEPATPSTPAEPAASASAQAAPQSSAAAAPSATPSQPADADTVKRHLTAARDTLSQITQLPAAAQLTGDARTQVSQLISNFNELITTNVDWRASYTKLQGNLDALIGSAEATTAAATPAPAPATGTAGAVGTSGTTTIDPAIRAKLVEFRSHLADFEKAAGGGAQASAASSSNAPAASAASSPSASAPAAPATEPSASTIASAASPASASATATPSASASASPSASSSATASATPTGTSGSTAQEPATAGTSGTGTPAPATEQATKPAASAQASEGHREAMSHVDAIEAIVGKSGKTSLDAAKVDEIRTHLKKLREELGATKK